MLRTQPARRCWVASSMGRSCRSDCWQARSCRLPLPRSCFVCCDYPSPHILCPIDLSDTSIRALTYATACATWYEAQLEVLHVVPAFEEGVVSEPSGRTSEPGSPVSRDAIVSERRRSIESGNATRLNPKVLAQEGRAHEAIVHRAHAQPADPIVMGTHGRSGFNRLLLGSVTEKVLRTATCPVLTVRVPRHRDHPFPRVVITDSTHRDHLRDPLLRVARARRGAAFYHLPFL